MRPVPADGLLHPVALAAIAALVINDHVLKGAFPGWWTGKLSDVAGLLFFPLFLQAALEVVADRAGRAWGPSRRVLVGCAIATALVFAAVQTVPAATDAYRYGLAALQWPFRAVAGLVVGRGLPGLGAVSVTADPTDLLTLPAVLGAVALGWRRSG